MILLLTGTHGSGKTTIAEKASEAFDLPFYKSRASEAYTSRGITFAEAGSLTIAQRLEIQCDIFGFWAEDYQKATSQGAGIFDRCPIDFAAYTLSEIRSNSSEPESAAIEAYIESCFDVLRLAANDSTIMLVQPHNIEMTDRGSSKPAVSNSAYSRQIHCLVHGLLLQSGCKFDVMPSADIASRMDMLTRYINAKFDDAADEAAQSNLEYPPFVSKIQ